MEDTLKEINNLTQKRNETVNFYAKNLSYKLQTISLNVNRLLYWGKIIRMNKIHATYTLEGNIK